MCKWYIQPTGRIIWFESTIIRQRTHHYWKSGKYVCRAGFCIVFFFFVWCAIRTLPICRECVWFCVTHSRHCFAVCDYVCVSKCGQPEPANGVSNWGREKKWFVLAMRSDINARYSNVECSLFLLDNTVTDRWKGIKNRKHAETNGIKKKNDSRI